MKNTLLILARKQRGWKQRQLADFAGVSLSTIERAERGESIRVDNIERICQCLQNSPEELGLLEYETLQMSRRQANKALTTLLGSTLTFPSSLAESLSHVWIDDMLSMYQRGMTACLDLYYAGNPQQVEALLPLYRVQTASLANQSSPLQQSAARLASLAHQLSCELATDREDFGTAQEMGRHAFLYAQLADDRSLQVAALISLANIGFHRKLSLDALHAYKQAISLFDESVTPLLKGRTYAGIAEVYAMRQDLQASMRTMGLAYEHYPLKPEEDPAYPYLRASRYALYVFGDAQSRLFLQQPREADTALTAMMKESNNDPDIEPITKLDLLYYQAEIQLQQQELTHSSSLLTEAAHLARTLGSRLYFNKLATSYYQLQIQWPHEPVVKQLEEVFQPW